MGQVALGLFSVVCDNYCDLYRINFVYDRTWMERQSETLLWMMPTSQMEISGFSRALFTMQRDNVLMSDGHRPAFLQLFTSMVSALDVSPAPVRCRHHMGQF